MGNLIQKESLNPARFLYYLFFSKVFLFTNNKNRYQDLDKIVQNLLHSAMNLNVQEALNSLNSNLQTNSTEALAQEYELVFHSIKPAPVRNTASFYTEGYESGKTLLDVKNLIAHTNFRKNEQVFKESEDSVGFLCKFQSQLLDLEIKSKDESEKAKFAKLSKELFEQILNIFIDEFNEALFLHQNSKIYKEISRILGDFIEFERLFYEINKPENKITKKQILCDGISEQERLRREKNRAKRLADLEKSASNLNTRSANEK